MRLYGPMLSMIDVLVDGRFVEALKDISLPFRGSSNQRILNLRATPEQEREAAGDWQRKNLDAVADMSGDAWTYPECLWYCNLVNNLVKSQLNCMAKGVCKWR